MLVAVVNHAHCFVGLFFAVQRDSVDGGSSARVADGDVVEGLTVAAVDLELVPLRRKTRGKTQSISYGENIRSRSQVVVTNWVVFSL